jgi:Ca2+-binding EF-hand superfamily protein
MFVGLGLVVLCSDSPGSAQNPKTGDKGPRAADDVYDFVFLGESRPVLVRFHVWSDGRPLRVAWDECIDHLFKYLDVNGDGMLSRDELDRAPTPDQFTGGGGLGGFGGRGRGAQAAIKFESVDGDGDGKVTPAELAAFYRNSGFVPFQFDFSNGPVNPLGAVASLFGGGRSEPSVEAVSKASFDLLDTEKNGKLAPKQLAAAEEILLQMDENEDEIVTTREITPNENANGNQLAAMFMMGGGGKPATSSPLLVPVLKAGEVPADLVSRMMARYGPDEKPKRELTRKDVGLDEAVFRALDVNNDGVLDADEIGGFIKRGPDIEFNLHLGPKKGTEPQLAVAGTDGRSPLGNKYAHGLLDLGLTRAELRIREAEDPADAARIAALRQDTISQFRQFAGVDGTVDVAAANGNQRPARLFKVMDRDGDGKLTEKEVNAYFDHLAGLQKRVTGGSVTLAVTNQSRGLFGLLDTNGDGRLSVREMRQAPKLLKQFDRGNKGYLTAEDLPHTYRLEIRRASFTVRNNNPAAAVRELYGSAYESSEADGPQRGPLWFRKMDRNRDGDVSRKEWLFGEESFKQIDTDGDGLISVAEAEKADAQFRKEPERQKR